MREGGEEERRKGGKEEKRMNAERIELRGGWSESNTERGGSPVLQRYNLVTQESNR